MVFPFGKPRRVYTRRRITLAPSVQHDCLHYAGLLLQVVVVVLLLLLLLSREFSQELAAGWCFFCWCVLALCVLRVSSFAAIFSFYRHERAAFLPPCSSIIAAFYSLLSLLLVLVSSCSSYTYYVGLFF
jgi:hypothetical protein